MKFLMVLKEYFLDKLESSDTLLYNSIADEIADQWSTTYNSFLNLNDVLINLDFNILHPDNIVLDRICKVKLASIKSKDGYLIITSDNTIHKSLIKNNIPCKYVSKFSVVHIFRELYKKFKIIITVLIDILIGIIIYYSSSRIRKRLSNHKILLYDVFVLKNSLDTGVFVDRWYVGFDNTKVNFQNYYIPTILESPIKKLAHHFNGVYSRNKILIKDSFLTPLNHLNILSSFFYNRTPAKFNFNIADLDLQDIISNEIKKSKFCISRYRSKKNIFFKNLKTLNCDLKVIEWNENQIIDKTFCFFFQKYYSKANIVSIRPFLQSRHLLNLFITDYDIKNNLCSIKVYNTSLAMQKFVPHKLRINSLLLPYNRRSNLSTQAIGVFNNIKAELCILAVLPLDLDRSIEIIKHLIHLENNFRIYIRPHPNNYNYFKNNTPLNLIIIDDDQGFCESIRVSDIVLTSSTSFVIEAIELNKKVIIIAGNGDLFKIPLKEELNESSYKISLSPSQTKQFVGDFIHKNKPITNENYFAEKQGIISPSYFFDL
jgi:hypothetical protein